VETGVPVQEAAEEAGLIYVTDSMPGITRKRVGEDFAYYGPDGKKIKDKPTLERIRSLAIPPAYEDVWVCPLADGHLQATGKDARGRKQYRYHPRFREVRDQSKYSRMVDFGKALPKIHERIDRDLSLKGFPREKVLATIVYLLEKSLIRVGNEEYAKENKSYGLTTMKNRHVKVEGQDIKFSFMGKSHVKHKITLHDRKLARVVAKLQELPGQELFQYLDHDGNRHVVTSADVNAYLKEVAEAPFTAKDFRTWAGTVLAAESLRDLGPSATQTATKANVIAAVDKVAGRLGNTRAVCRSSYIHPAVLLGYETGTLCLFDCNGGGDPGLDPEERWALAFLKEATLGDRVTG
jgi:DNA topoisomerase-1